MTTLSLSTGLFSVILKSSPVPVKNPNWREANQLFTKRGEFAPGITEDKFIQ